MKGVTIAQFDTESRKNLDLRAGDTVKVWQKIKEGDKTRLQLFEGLVLARKHGVEAGGSFTVRRTASGVGVERIFPLYSPAIDKIEIVKRSKVRRAKLFHVRDKAAKEISREMRHLREMKDEDAASMTTDRAGATGAAAESGAEAKADEAKV
jgi:large subunit ribosomal protein L19